MESGFCVMFVAVVVVAPLTRLDYSICVESKQDVSDTKKKTHGCARVCTVCPYTACCCCRGFASTSALLGPRERASKTVGNRDFVRFIHTTVHRRETTPTYYLPVSSVPREKA